MRRRRLSPHRARLLALVPLFLATTAQRSSLHIDSAGVNVEWWSADRAPVRWAAPLPAVTNAFQWRTLRRGLELAETDLLVNHGLLRLRVVAVRLDPAAFELRLEQLTARDGVRGAWSIERAPANAAFAVNAGQFAEAGPWGWLVRDRVELQYPGRGPLAMAFTLEEGGVRWYSGDAVFERRRQPPPRLAFQSYPLLLDSAGTVPSLLRTSPDVDRTHRDTRLAVGRISDGRLLFVLTRFAGAGALFERLPAGLTTPEMAALMGALGARPALMLDGGLSAQMMVRDGTGVAKRWHGGRTVPLALVAIPRPD